MHLLRGNFRRRGSRGYGFEDAHLSELLIPLLFQRGSFDLDELCVVLRYCFSNRSYCFHNSAVGAAFGLGDDLVDEAELEGGLGGEAEGHGGFVSLFGGSPEDGGAAFGRNDRV